jgi:hypothetical protein
MGMTSPKLLQVHKECRKASAAALDLLELPLHTHVHNIQ